MDFFSHLLIGVLTSIFSLKKFAPEFITFAGVMVILPDIDIFLHPLGRKYYYLSHRCGFHSYIIAIFIAAVSGGIFSYITGYSFFSAWLIGFLFYSLHITLDFITTSKIPLFYPISKKEYRFGAERAINPLLMFISAIIVFIFIRLNQIGAKWIIFRTLVNICMIAYMSYLIYRLSTKIWIQYRLNEGIYFIPDFIPFFYYIYEKQDEKDRISFKLIKKIQFFSKDIKKKIHHIKKNSKEMNFFKKAIDLSKQYRFFNKWERIFPVIENIENTISIKIFLAESIIHNLGYFLEVVYDKKTNNIIKKSDGFNIIK